MAFNDRDSWVNFNKEPYIDQTGKPVIVTSADASKTPLLDAEYTRQDEQRWEFPDVEAEKKWLNVPATARKAEIADAYGWLKEMYLKMRHDAKQDFYATRQKLTVVAKERDQLLAGKMPSENPFSVPGAVDAPAPKAKGFDLNSFIMGGMLVAGGILAAVIGMNIFG